MQDLEVDELDACYEQTLRTQLQHILQQHPCTVSELATSLHLSVEEIQQFVDTHPAQYELSKTLCKRLGERLIQLKK